jgi:hypothetical protein
MSQKSTTKDELFLLKLHQMATQRGEPHEEIDRYAIGRAIGQNDKGIDTIARCLAQANFVKKGDGNAIYLTSNGLRLVEHLLEVR